MNIVRKILWEGVYSDPQTGEFIFDFNEDNKERDFIYLKVKPYNMKLASRRGASVFIGYKFIGEKNDDRERFQKALKAMEVDKNKIDQLVSKAILSFDNIYKLSSFDLIITPKSSKPLANYIAEKVSSKIGQNTLLATDTLVKNIVENIRIDTTGMQPKTIASLEKILKKGDLTGKSFEIKTVPVMFRKKISNFIKFKDETTREIYNKVTEGKVLIVDDYLTTGSTLVEMTNIVKNLGAKEVINFVLVAS